MVEKESLSLCTIGQGVVLNSVAQSIMGVASGWHGYGAAYLRLVQTYYLHLIISALLELKIYLKISVHL